MNEIEQSLRSTLEIHPGDWSIRLLVADKMLERDAPGEAADLLLAAPAPPETDPALQRVAEIAGEDAIPLAERFISAQPANPYGHVVLAALLELRGDHDRAEQHRSVAGALGGQALDIAPVPPEEEYVVVEPVSAGPLPEAPYPGVPLPPGTFVPPPPDASIPAEQGVDLSAPVKPARQAGKKTTAIMAAFLVHAVLLLIAGLMVILPPAKDEPEIVAAVIAPPKQKQEMQKKNVVKQTKKTTASAAAAAPLAQLMRSNAIAKISLPDVTKTSTGPLGIGEADFGGGGFGGTGGGMGTGASFFGGTSTGNRFLFVIDHSGSMSNLQVQLRNDELEKALRSLNGAEYQVLLFAGGAYYAWEGWSLEQVNRQLNVATGPDGKYEFAAKGGAANFDFRGSDEKLPRAEWIKATPGNVKKTMEFVKKEKLFYGTDWGLALDIGHRMQPAPDAIFFMSDGTGGNSPPPILATNSKFGKPPINTVAMQTTDGIKQFAEIAEKTKGSFTIVDKKGEPIDGFEYMEEPEKFKGRL